MKDKREKETIEPSKPLADYVVHHPEARKEETDYDPRRRQIRERYVAPSVKVTL